MAIETGLEGRPWYVSAIVGLILAGVIFAIMWFLQFDDQRETIAQRESKLTQMQVKIQEGRAAKRQLQQFREEVRRLELELEKLLRILPARRNTPELLRQIRALTSQGNFDLLLFRPGGLQDQEFYSVWPIRIELNGTYHNLGMLFDRVARFSRIINVDDLRIEAIRRSEDSRHTIHASFTANTFVYKEPPPPSETATGEAGTTTAAGGAT